MPKEIEPFYRALGEAICRAREARGLSQQALGDLLPSKQTRASIANIENGKQRVLAHALLDFAAALELPVMELLKDVSHQSREVGKVASEIKKKLPLDAEQQRTLLRKLRLPIEGD